MLVLTRRHGESIHIGDDIDVTVLEIGRDQVRIGILAPGSVAVHREEVYQEILVANQAAATGTTAQPSPFLSSQGPIAHGGRSPGRRRCPHSETNGIATCG